MGIWLVESIKLLSFGYVLCIFSRLRSIHRFEDQYYESENIRMRRMYAEKKGLDIEDLIPEINKSEMSVSASKNVVRTIELLESVAKDLTSFPVSNGDRSEAQGDDVSRQEQD